MRQLLIAVLSWAAVPSVVLALTLPSAQGYVSDFAELLSEADKTALEEQLRVFAEQTSTEISVVTIVSLEGETIEYYAGKLFEAWKIGQQRIDNGVLLLVAPNEREVRIEVGYGLEGALPDALAHRIIQDDILPVFRAGDYTAGMQRGVAAIISATKGEYTASSEASSSTADAVEGWFFVIIFGLQFGLAIMARTKSWWLGGIFGALIALVIALIVQSIISFVAVS